MQLYSPFLYLLLFLGPTCFAFLLFLLYFCHFPCVFYSFNHFYSLFMSLSSFMAKHHELCQGFKFYGIGVFQFLYEICSASQASHNRCLLSLSPSSFLLLFVCLLLLSFFYFISFFPFFLFLVPFFIFLFLLLHSLSFLFLSFLFFFSNPSFVFLFLIFFSFTFHFLHLSFHSFFFFFSSMDVFWSLDPISNSFSHGKGME